MADVVDETYLDHQGLPELQPVRGKDGFACVVEVARSGYVTLSVKIADLIEGDDRAAARLVWSAESENGDMVRRETLENRSGSGRLRGGTLGRAFLARTGGQQGAMNAMASR